jgi:hypothetical protein
MIRKKLSRIFIKNILLLFVICFASGSCVLAQTSDKNKAAKDSTLRPYFIITAGPTILAYFQDKPLHVDTITEFNDWVQANAKMLKNARVVVTGKPKTDSFDAVLKTLSRFHIKDVSKNIVN